MNQVGSKSLIDRYQIERQLGRGGFGETFLAKDTRMPTERTVVIKKLKPINQQNIDYQVIKDSFKKEATVLEELGRNHPNIPELYDYFEDEGEFYLVQEYIEGKTLAEISPISQEQTFSILNSLLRTLQYLQERKLIHRDIKPENIIVRSADGLPVLIDFGAVKDSMGKVRRSSGSVMSSMVIGTRGFMAPEQSEGSPIFSSDLYSLARTMIFALTNKLPNEMEKNMLTGQLDWQKYLPTLDPTLARVLDTASQLSPERRYPTAEEMYRDLHSSQGNSKGQSTAYSQTPSGRETERVAEEFHPGYVSPPSYDSYPSEPVKKQSVFKIVSLVLLGCLVLFGIGIGSYALTKVIADLQDKADKQEETIAKLNETLDETKGQLDQTNEQLTQTKGQLDQTNEQLTQTKGQLDQTNEQLTQTKGELGATQDKIKEFEDGAIILKLDSPPSSSSSSSRPYVAKQSQCGSPNNGERQWWAVKTHQSNLNLMTSRYCEDAYISKGETQVASFTSESEAKRFARKLNAHSGKQFWVRQSIRR
jgi:serine/threonine protein kinase